MANAVLAALHSQPAGSPAIQDGSACLNYAELSHSVAAEILWLQSMRVQRCGLLVANGVPWVISDLALMARGIVQVPIPGFFTAAQREHALDDAGIDFMLTDQPAMLATEHPEFLSVAKSPHTGLTLLQRPPRATVKVIPPGTQKITYTSGSTGQPKGVCLSEASLMAVAQSLAAVTASVGTVRHMCLLPLATLLENVAGVYVPLLLGAEIVVPPSQALGISYGGVDARRLLQALSTMQPGSLVLVPELLRLMLHACESGWTPPRSLRFIAVGGASVSTELLARAHACRLPVFEGYGLSECASVVCLNTPAAIRPGSVGRPLPHVRVRIDANREICVSGAAMHGYLGDPDGNDGEIRTGDLGDIDADGFVYVRGRVKNMFITSMGRNVEPEWVERELTSDIAISYAMVVGEARPFPIAIVSPMAQATRAQIDRVVANANLRLPEYARVRQWVEFPEAPSTRNGLLTANGRLKREAIVARLKHLIPATTDPTEMLADVVS